MSSSELRAASILIFTHSEMGSAMCGSILSPSAFSQWITQSRACSRCPAFRDVCTANMKGRLSCVKETDTIWSGVGQYDVQTQRTLKYCRTVFLLEINSNCSDHSFLVFFFLPIFEYITLLFKVKVQHDGIWENVSFCVTDIQPDKCVAVSKCVQ